MPEHPDREALRSFLVGGLSEDEAETVAAHLKEKACLRCLFLARELFVETEPALGFAVHWLSKSTSEPCEERDAALELALIQARRRGCVIDAERALAQKLLTELGRHSPEAARTTVRSSKRYQLFGLSEHLIEVSQKEAFQDIARAVEMAELAVEVADCLDPRVYMAVTCADQRALARAYLGNARRVASDLFGAERTFEESLLLLKEGNRTSIVPADVWSLLGSLRIDQGRYVEARQLLRRALALYRSFRSTSDEGKVLMKLANAEGYSGNSEAAVEILHKAAGRFEEAGEERLLLWAHHNLIYWMVDAGQAAEAFARYQETRSLYDDLDAEPSIRLRLRWLEGRIYAALGDFELARQAFEEVRETAAEADLSYEVAMISPELALVYANLGETERVRALAEETTPVFRAYQLSRHAIAANSLLPTHSRQPLGS